MAEKKSHFPLKGTIRFAVERTVIVKGISKATVVTELENASYVEGTDFVVQGSDDTSQHIPTVILGLTLSQVQDAIDNTSGETVDVQAIHTYNERAHVSDLGVPSDLGLPSEVGIPSDQEFGIPSLFVSLALIPRLQGVNTIFSVRDHSKEEVQTALENSDIDLDKVQFWDAE